MVQRTKLNFKIQSRVVALMVQNTELYLQRSEASVRLYSTVVREGGLRRSSDDGTVHMSTVYSVTVFGYSAGI